MAMKRIKWSDFNEPAVNVRFTGVWDMQDLYESLADWFRRRKYHLNERIYKHKHPSPYGVERQYCWEATKKETDYIQVRYYFYIHTYDAHDIEVEMPDGAKKVFTKGRLWMHVRFSTISDYEGRWNQRLFYSHLKDFYNKYVIRKSFTEGWNPRRRYEMYELQAMMKKRLKMEADEFEHRHFAGVYKQY